MQIQEKMKECEIYMEERFSHGELIRHFYEIIKILRKTTNIIEFEGHAYLPRIKTFRKGIFLRYLKYSSIRPATEAEAKEYEEAKILNMLRTKL
jgi:hypothetical protein